MAQTYPHEDIEFFKLSVESVQSKTNFDPLLIEKDYYCSLILRMFFSEVDDTNCI